MRKQTGQERLGISDGTFPSMKRFFLKTSVPRILAKKQLKEVFSK